MKKSSYVLGLAVVLLSCIYTLWGVSVEGSKVMPGTWVSVLEWVSPALTAVIMQEQIYNFLKAFFYLSSVAWVGALVLKLSKKHVWVIALLNTLSFFLVSTAYWESRSWFGHSLVLGFWFLLFLTFHSFSGYKNYRAWPFQYGFLIYTWFYFLAGIKKLYEGGLEWIMGDSLALWHHMMGQVEIVSTQVFPVLAGLTVLIEVGVIFLLLSGRKGLCLLAPILIIALHLGIYLILDFNFIGHILLSLYLIYLIVNEQFYLKLSVKQLLRTTNDSN